MSRCRTASLLLAVLVGGCEASSSGADASRDAASDGLIHLHTSGDCSASGPLIGDYADRATPSPDGAGWCCPTGTPSCGCGYFGGFVHSRCSCGEYFPTDRTDTRRDAPCDLAPADWILATDAHGCMAYSQRPVPTQCCICQDAGTDAGAVDDAGSEDAR